MKRIDAVWAMVTPAMMALALIAVFALSWPAGASAPSMGTISGIVENHTGGTRPASGIALKLTVFVNGAEQDSMDAVTDARGRFSFTAPADPQRSYVAKLTYKGGEYETPAITLQSGQSARQVHIRVYEPTNDPSVVKVNVHHVIVEPGEGAVQVAELLVFTNKTDRTYIGGQPRADGKRETLRFSLPAGATNVQYMEGLMECCVSATDTGLVDTMDVEPGMRSIGYSYTLAVSRASLAIKRRLDYPAERLEVFGNTASQLTVPPLVRQDDVKAEQGVYARFSGSSLRAGTDVTLALSGLPVPRSSRRRVAVAAFAGLVVAALTFPFLRRGRRPPGPKRPTQTREELIRAIAALDDRFEAGEIPQVEYRARRVQMMKEIHESNAQERTRNGEITAR